MRYLLIIALVLRVTLAWGSQIDTLTIKSTEMNKQISNLIILPDSYLESNKQFPVLYLLHGANGDFVDWVKKVPKLAQYVDQYNFIIVCPDGGKTSWYFDSPIDKSMRYETYVSKELISAVDKEFRTIPRHSSRAISGLSMGGHGAFYLAFRHQNIWGAAGSTSGGLDFRPFPSNWSIYKRLGQYADNKEVWEESTVINMVYMLDGKNLKLIFDCGVDDFFYDGNKRMHEKLLERNVPHDYIARPGKHNNEYWDNSIKYQLLFFHDFFASTDRD